MFLEWDRLPGLSYVGFLIVWYVVYQQLRGPQGSPKDLSSRTCASRRPRSFDVLFLASFGCLVLYLRQRLQQTVAFEEEAFFGGSWALVGYMACATAFGFLVAYGANAGHALVDDAWFYGSNPEERMQPISMVTTFVLLLWAASDVLFAARDPSAGRNLPRLSREIFLPRLLVVLVWVLAPALSYSNSYLFTGNSLSFVVRGSLFAILGALFFVRPALLSFMGTAVAVGLLLYEVCRYGIQAPWGVRGRNHAELCPHGLTVHLQPYLEDGSVDKDGGQTFTKTDNLVIERIKDTLAHESTRGVPALSYDATLLGYFS